MVAIRWKCSLNRSWMPPVVLGCFLLTAILTITKYNELPPTIRQSSGRNSKVVIKEQIINHPIFAPTAVTEEIPRGWSHQKQVSLELEKKIEKKQPPKNKFRWLYKDNSTLIYSAHYDSRDFVIKLVGFKHRFYVSRQEQLLLCQYPDGKIVPMTTLYNVSVMSPRPGLEYNTWIWQCEWKGLQPPAHLSLVTQSKQVLVDSINVTYHRFADGTEKVLQPVICVKPMVKGYNDSYQLIEFIKTSRLWGASKIVLYPYSIDESVIRPILTQYESEGLVDIHEWRPPVPVKSLHAFGQKSHNQHCLYTYMYRYQWAAFIDLDELIVAGSKITSLESMIQEGLKAIQDPATQAHVAGFVLRSQMCPITLADDPKYFSEGANELCRITSMRKTNCTPPMQPGVWSKPLVNTDGTEVVDIHTIRLARPPYTTINMPATVGTVLHYRALKRSSQVLAQSAQYNVLNRDTHKHMQQARTRMKDICSYNNPLIGAIKFAD